jgi:hypothetical protein
MATATLMPHLTIITIADQTWLHGLMVPATFSTIVDKDPVMVSLYTHSALLHEEVSEPHTMYICARSCRPNYLHA